MKSIFASQNYASYAFGSATFDGGIIGGGLAVLLSAFSLPRKKRKKKRGHPLPTSRAPKRMRRKGRTSR